ncbi:MAG TPA: YraN family protein [Candidatus Saccharimonadales bacterium]|nr:YraN family protein [Candidatus Saccharimonadales bacterium]
MSATDTGRRAEDAAADYLARHGFAIVERNFRMPQCEIDIIAKKGPCLYFVEVKYRASTRQGGGLEYITAAKQRQMHYAANTWLAAHDWPGETVLAGLEVSGADFAVAAFVEAIDA